MSEKKEYLEVSREEEPVNVALHLGDPEEPLTSLVHYGATKLTKRQKSKIIPKDLNKDDRAVSKDGITNYSPTNVQKQRIKYFSDLFTTLLEIRWRWTLFFFCFTYFGSWFLFAIAWYIILWLHGDLQNYEDPDWKPCVTKIDNFAKSFLFSVETQHTTGYGFYELKDECPDAVILFCIQSIVGVIIEGLMVGLLFVKMIRAKKRTATLLFSNKAVICKRDKQLCFMFRVADMRKSHLLEAHVRAQIIRKRTTAEGEVVNYHQEELEVGGEGEKNNQILLFWPTLVVHKIDKKSPLFNLLNEETNEKAENSFEIIVVLEGIVESTGLTTQARSSYLPSEILWGHRFVPMPSSKNSAGERVINFDSFHQTVLCE